MAKRTVKPPALKAPSSDPILKELEAQQEEKKSGMASLPNAAALIPHVKIIDPDKDELIPMAAWVYVVHLLVNIWPVHRRTLRKKARQLGLSWAFALYALFHCGSRPFRNFGSFNYNIDAAAEMLWRMNFLNSTLPESLKLKGDFGKYSIDFANGSRALALPTTDVAGAGKTFSLAVIDEAGLIKKLHENWAAILPAIEFGQLHIFSTIRDDEGKFYELCSDAEAGKSTFNYEFLNWDLRPDRDQNTEVGRAWLAKRKAELSPEEFAREYEGKALRSGACYFGNELMEKLRAAVRVPLEIIWGGALKIYQRPQAGATYEVGADVAEGLADGDYSSAHVRNSATGEIVATLHGHFSVTEWAELLVKLGRLYNNAWISIEANNHGHAVCAWAYHHLHYRKIAREHREAEGQLGGESMRLGILTTNATKPAMLAQIEQSLRTGTTKLPDAATVEELATFLRLPGGAYGAAPGRKDDRVMSLALTLCGRLRRTTKCG